MRPFHYSKGNFHFTYSAEDGDRYIGIKYILEENTPTSVFLYTSDSLGWFIYDVVTDWRKHNLRHPE